MMLLVHRNSIGAVGEDLVLQRYLAQGGIFLGRNIYSRFGEIDLVVLLKRFIHVIEVKTTETRFNSVSLVNERKVNKINRTFEIWLNKFKFQNEGQLEVKFCVYVVSLDVNIKVKQYFIY